MSGSVSDLPDPRVLSVEELEQIRDSLDPESSIQVCQNEHTLHKDETRIWLTCDEAGLLDEMHLYSPEDDVLIDGWVRRVMTDHTGSVLRSTGLRLLAALVAAQAENEQLAALNERLCAMNESLAEINERLFFASLGASGVVPPKEKGEAPRD